MWTSYYAKPAIQSIDPDTRRRSSRVNPISGYLGYKLQTLLTSLGPDLLLVERESNKKVSGLHTYHLHQYIGQEFLMHEPYYGNTRSPVLLQNMLAKLGDAIATSKSETITDSLTHSLSLTGVGIPHRRSYSHLGRGAAGHSPAEPR